MRHWISSLVLAGSLSITLDAFAEDIHVSPGAAGDGSPDAPMGDVASALAAASDGDRVILHGGDYGDVALRGSFGAETFVEAAAGETARMRTLAIRASHLTVRGVSVSLSWAEPYETATMITVEGGSEHVRVLDCEVFSAPDEVTAGWGAADWADRPGTGISVRAAGTELAGNRVRNVGYGISIGHDAPNAVVRGNLVENFSRDGLRGIGDYGVFEYNLVRNAYDVDDHHDDFFQSWSLGEDGTPGAGVRRGIVLRGNLFINFDDPEQPFAGAAQGIGCFDGFFEDWIVENNVVVVNHWHGITFLGARNVRIVNNTVIDNRPGESPGPPWIQIGPHKDGRPSEDVIVRNNVTTDLDVVAERAAEDHNLVVADPAAVLVDPLAFDFHLRSDASDAIDTGSAEGAPAVDRDGITRPQGAGFDLGAHEWHDGTATPVDAGVGPPPVRSDGGLVEEGAGGCGCALARPDGTRHLAVLGLAAWIVVRRRRRDR